MEFTIGNNTYRAGKLDAFTQLHITRRLTPCLSKLAGLASGEAKFKYDENGKVMDMEGNLDNVLTPLSSAITAMSDADVEYVINACLAVTERKQPGGSWSFLRVNNVNMFDLTLAVLLQISYQVVKENIMDFFGELPSLSNLQGFMKEKGLAS